ncbi:MAG TPA: tetratricopeptide repeat protein [Vicinamibacterales bacterium]|nr:tetratricopeptide repeat protein [Vicinamibacterales bacterium]
MAKRGGGQRPARRAPLPSRSDGRSAGSWWRAALLVVATSVVYANSLHGPFIYDDRGTVLENTTIERLGDVGQVLRPPRETPVAGRPVVNVSFALNYAIGGHEVTGYHVVNIALHLACGLLLFAVVRQGLTSPAAVGTFGGIAGDLALAVSLLWLLHPINNEVVNYLSQRTESMMALWALATLYASQRVMSGDARRTLFTGTAIAACALGMASKESMVTVPVLVALYDRIFVAGSWRRVFADRAGLYAGLAATWIVLAVLVATSPRTLSAGFTAHDADVVTYLLNQAVMIVRYLTLAIWPRGLVLYYGWPLPLTIADVWPQLLLIAALAALTILALARWPRAGYLGAWVFITLAPTSSIVPIATEVGAERRMYLPMMALVVLAVTGAAYWLLRRRSPSPIRLLAAPVAIAAIAYSAASAARNREYASSLTLAETTAARWPTPAGESMYGTELAAAGRLDDAERHLRAAAASFEPARYYLGTVLAKTGRVDEAAEQLRAFIASQPAELDQVHLARAVLADAYMRTGQWDRATEQYAAMVAARPNDLEAEALLAGALVRAQRFSEAITHYQRVVQARPNDAAGHGGLGVALASAGRLDEAIPAFARAAELDPGNGRAHQNLARALLGRRDLDRAADAANRAIAAAPNDPTAYDLLAQILFALGRPAEAQRAQQTAARLRGGG